MYMYMYIYMCTIHSLCTLYEHSFITSRTCKYSNVMFIFKCHVHVHMSCTCSHVMYMFICHVHVHMSCSCPYVMYMLSSNDGRLQDSRYIYSSTRVCICDSTYTVVHVCVYVTIHLQ